MFINIAELVLREVESCVNTKSISRILSYIKDVTEKYVDVFMTYTLYEECNDEKIDIESIIDRARLSTALFQRFAILCDSYTFRLVYNSIRSIVVRGAVVLIVLDYQDIRDIVHDLDIIYDIENIEEYPKAIAEALDISESIEKVVILRIPIFIKHDSSDREEKLEIYKRNIGLFYRDWKYTYAWISSDIRYIDNNEKIQNRCIRILEIGTGQELIIVDKPLRRFILNGADLDKYRFIIPEIYTINKIENINAKSIITICRRFIRKYEKYHYIDTYKLYEKYVEYLRNNITGKVRLLLSIPLTLLNLFKDLNILVLSSFKIPNISKTGKYDVRFITKVPENIFDCVDIQVKKISELEIFEDKIPKSINIIYLSTKLDFKDIDNINKLRRTLIITYYDDDIVKFLKLKDVKYVILDIDNDIIYRIYKAIGKVSIILLKYYPRGVVCRFEYCDRCGMCSKLMCRAITFQDSQVKIIDELCDRCQACVVACTRGVFSLKDQEV